MKLAFQTYFDYSFSHQYESTINIHSNITDGANDKPSHIIYEFAVVVVPGFAVDDM